MANDKLKTLHLGIPGIILLHEDISTGQLTILDGQHRVGMMQVLLKQQKKNSYNMTVSNEKESNSNNTTSLALSTRNNTSFDLDNILVEVYPQQSSILAQDLFLEVNKAEPVKLIDLPGVSKVKDRNIITDAVEELSMVYPNMFKPSQRCRMPHVNVDNVRDNLFASNIIAKHNISSRKQLYEWLIKQNQSLEKKYNALDTVDGIPKMALDKAKTNKFYLGLESSWLYN